MNKIFVTGDLHSTIDMHKLSVDAFPEQKQLDKCDYVIICGDFGGVWDGGKTDKYIQKWLEDKPFTTLFVAGNHENHPLLGQYEVNQWNGGNVHFIQPSIIHLMNGQVFTINNMKFFVMGGARSTDKEYRVIGKSWWPEEMPSQAEYDEALYNLGASDWKVDFVLSHCAPDSVQHWINPAFEHDGLTFFLETVKQDLNYRAWFFGHYHINKKIDDKHFCLYEQIGQIT